MRGIPVPAHVGGGGHDQDTISQRIVAKFIDSVRGMILDELSRQHTILAKWGVIVIGGNGLAVQPPSGGVTYYTTTVVLGDDGVSVPGIRYDSSYTPTIGDQVLCSQIGQDTYVLSHPHS